MGFTPFSYWGNNLGTIVPNGLVFYHTPSSFTGTGQWLDVSGNGNHAYVSGAAMGNDSLGWMFNGGTFSTGSNSMVWSSSLAQQPSSSFTLQWYGKLYTEGNPIFNARYLWRTTNEDQDLSGSGWSIDYGVDYLTPLTYSGSINTGGGQMYPLSASLFNGTTPAVYTLTFNNGTQSLYINDNASVIKTQTAPIFEFTGSTAGLSYPITFGKAPLHVRCDAYSWSNPSGKTSTIGWVDENHNYDEALVGGSSTVTFITWPSSTIYKVDGWQGSESSLINVGTIPTSSLLEPLINQNGIYGIGISGSINSLLCYNRVLSAGEIINNATVLLGSQTLTPNILPSPAVPTAVTESAVSLSLHLDAKNGYWYNQSTWYDISGNGNNLTLTGSVTYDPITGSVGFYGNYEDYFIKSTGTTGLNLSTSASVEVWLKWWGGQDRDYYRNAFSLGKSTAGPLSGSYVSVLFADPGYSRGLEGRWGPLTTTYLIPSASGTHNYTKLNSNNVWRQCVLVKTGDTMEYYVNGTLESTQTSFSGSISGSVIMVGGITPSGTPTTQFIGEVGIVKVWNGKSLTATEVSASFTSYRSRFGI
jgi:hypothetical protein